MGREKRPRDPNQAAHYAVGRLTGAIQPPRDTMKTIHRDGEPESHAERAYQFVRSGLPFDVGLLALSLYKEKTAAAKNKARAVLYFLEKRKRLIKRLPNGEWVPTNPEDMDGFNEAENEGPITNEH